MELPNISIGTQSKTGQGSGTLTEVSMEVEINGLGHFVQGSLHIIE